MNQNGSNLSLNYDELSKLIDSLEIDIAPAWAADRVQEPPSAAFMAEVLTIQYEIGAVVDGNPAAELAERLDLDAGDAADRARLLQLTTEVIEPMIEELEVNEA